MYINMNTNICDNALPCADKGPILAAHDTDRLGPAWLVLLLDLRGCLGQLVALARHDETVRSLRVCGEYGRRGEEVVRAGVQEQFVRRRCNRRYGVGGPKSVRIRRNRHPNSDA